MSKDRIVKHEIRSLMQSGNIGVVDDMNDVKSTGVDGGRAVENPGVTFVDEAGVRTCVVEETVVV